MKKFFLVMIALLFVGCAAHTQQSATNSPASSIDMSATAERFRPLVGTWMALDPDSTRYLLQVKRVSEDGSMEGAFFEDGIKMDSAPRAEIAGKAIKVYTQTRYGPLVVTFQDNSVSGLINGRYDTGQFTRQ